MLSCAMDSKCAYPVRTLRVARMPEIVYSVRLYEACEAAAGAADPVPYRNSPYNVPVDPIHAIWSQLTPGCAR